MSSPNYTEEELERINELIEHVGHRIEVSTFGAKLIYVVCSVEADEGAITLRKLSADAPRQWPLSIIGIGQNTIHAWDSYRLIPAQDPGPPEPERQTTILLW